HLASVSDLGPRGRWPRFVFTSIILRAFANPGADGVAVAGRELLLPVWHAHFGGAAPVEQPHEVAAVGIARDHHGTVLGALHHALVAREIETAFLECFRSLLVAAHAAAAKDRHHVFGEARRFGRAGLARLFREAGREQRHRGDRDHHAP